MQRERKTNLAIDELGLMLNPKDDNDKFQLGEILIEVMDYPTIQEAKVHRYANRLGNFDLLNEQSRLMQLLNSKNTEQLKLCACCGNIVNQSEIPFFSKIQNIKLGIGVRLYFMSLFYHILIFVVGFFLYSLYSLITNVNASRYEVQNIAALCTEKDQCSTANLGLGSKLMSNVSYTNELAIQSVLGFIFTVIWGIIIVSKHFQQYKLQAQLKSDWLSSSQFTLMIRDVPKGFIQKSGEALENIRQIFLQYQKAIKSKISFEVIKISVGYPLFKRHTELQKHKKQVQDEMNAKRDIFSQWLRYRQTNQNFQLSYQKRNEVYQSFYDFITKEYDRPYLEKLELDQSNIIFVTLRYSKAREIIEKLNKQSSSIWKLCRKQQNDKYKFPIAHVKIEKAPEPDQIKWENIGFASSVKFIRKFLIFGLASILIGISLITSIYLGNYQIHKKTYYISILISLVITTINFIMELIIIILSLFQNEFIKSEEEASIGIKIAVSQIANSIIVPILLPYFTGQAIFSSNGLVTNVFFIALINMILPIGRFIDPFNMLLKLREKYYSDPQRRLFDLKGQKDLNKIFTFYEFQLGYQYAYIIKTSFFTAFFMTLQPVITLFAPIGLSLMFFTNKYRLLYRFNKPNFHSSQVNRMLTFILKLSLVSFSLGQLYFINFQEYSIQFNLVINWISLGVSVIFILFPINFCRKYYVQNRSVGMDYKEKLLYLTTDYDRLNPVTKDEAISSFKNYLEQYEKRCHIPLPQKSQMIKRSLIETQKHNPLASFVNFIEKTKTKIMFQNQQFLGSELHSGDRIR